MVLGLLSTVSKGKHHEKSSYCNRNIYGFVVCGLCCLSYLCSVPLRTGSGWQADLRLRRVIYGAKADAVLTQGVGRKQTQRVAPPFNGGSLPIYWKGFGSPHHLRPGILSMIAVKGGVQREKLHPGHPTQE